MKLIPEVSICMSTHNKAALLKRTLESIFNQIASFAIEVIVVDDGPDSRESEDLCALSPVRYAQIKRDPVYRNPSRARNIAYKMARADIIIAQSDDVIHAPGAIVGLINELRDGIFVIAEVWDVTKDMKPRYCYSGAKNPRPFFFLGALYRRDLYAVGGNSEDFMVPGYDDDWFADCLIRGIGLKPLFSLRAKGYHQHHFHQGGFAHIVQPSKELYEAKFKAASLGKIKWEAIGGPWEYKP